MADHAALGVGDLSEHRQGQADLEPVVELEAARYRRGDDDLLEAAE